MSGTLPGCDDPADDQEMWQQVGELEEAEEDADATESATSARPPEPDPRPDAPHGGQLVRYGGQTGFVELVRQPQGKTRLYLLDADGRMLTNASNAELWKTTSIGPEPVELVASEDHSFTAPVDIRSEKAVAGERAGDKQASVLLRFRVDGKPYHAPLQ